ncbi:MAG: sigma 54-interacting transcriptional regulator [Zoogloeaceae bacterium]|jgi:transcriptional regulator with PAS, ATPase and Fis domain|nr:sigma 54-interacting transcriptional regulator [Zoogloeaceae bacterium]
MKFMSIGDNLTPSSRASDFEALYADDRWRALGDLIPDGLVMVDPAGLVRYMNSAAESINEVYRQMVVGHPLEDFVQQARLDYSVIPEAFHHGYARVNKVVRDAGSRSYLISTRSYRSWSGESSAFMILTRNLDALEKIARRVNDDEGAVPVFAPPPLGSPATAETGLIVNGQATQLAVTRGLRAIDMKARLLILGESGVGKTELARQLHRESSFAACPFVHVNCGSIPDSLFESEMFGYERGAFTGASSRGKKGLIEAAEGGILFLDEVGEIPLHCQAKILQAIEEGLVQRVGATAPRRLQLQIIAATNRDLKAQVEEGGFRRDLYYRLSAVTLLLPPLRERRELIPPLIDRFLTKVNLRRKTPLTLDPGCRRRLSAYAYPGNVRELQNIVEYLGVACDHLANEMDLPFFGQEMFVHATEAFAIQGAGNSDIATGMTLRDAMRHYESALIDAAIQKTGSKRKAAELLGVDIATIVRKSKTQSATGGN